MSSSTHVLLPSTGTPPSARLNVPGGARREGVAEGLRALRACLTDHGGRVAAVASFGAEAAVLLALVAEIDRATPVLFVDTGKHFPETLAYRRELAALLGLHDVRDIGPTASALADRDPAGQLHAFDPDACCALRKVEPLERALAPFDAWVTGRRRSQAATRAALPVVETLDGRTKLNPLAAWTDAEVEAEMVRRGLPRHPLTFQGYASIGCAPCTRPVSPGAGSRSGRWAGLAKTECGIHRPRTAISESPT
jgi:phosphoadenosine phosphosulfate reductase